MRIFRLEIPAVEIRLIFQIAKGEILKLLEAMESEPDSWDALSGMTFEREVALQQITELGA